MTYQRDAEILVLKKRAGADYRDLGNLLQLSPGCASQRVLGFIQWQSGERRRVIQYLQERIERQQETSGAAA